MTTGYRDLFTITVADHPFDLSTGVVQPGTSWQTVMLTNGAAQYLHAAEADVASVIQQRGRWWLRVDALDRDARVAMEAASISTTGVLDLLTSEFALLTLAPPGTQPLVTAQFRTATGTRVETATAATPLRIGMSSAAQLTPTSVRGHNGWLVTYLDPDGTSRTELTWSETADRTVVIDLAPSDADLGALAESLQPVTYHAWRDASCATAITTPPGDTVPGGTLPTSAVVVVTSPSITG